MIQEYTRLARPYFVLLAIVTLGRWLMGTAFHVPYEKGTNVLSIVTLTMFASIFSAAFTRRWLGYRLMQAAGFAMFMALRLPARGAALDGGLLRPRRSRAISTTRWRSTDSSSRSGSPPPSGSAAGGLVVNTILNGIAGALGWALGALLPVRDR